MGAQLSKLTFTIELALVANQEVAAKFPTEQNRELQQIANCQKGSTRRRRGFNVTEAKTSGTDQGK